MAILSNFACTDFLALLLAVGFGVFTYFKWAFGYWKKKGVPYLKPFIPMGNLECPIIPKRSFGQSVREWYGEAKRRGDKHVGLFIFTKPVYMPIDLEFVRNVVAKDFDHFVDRGVFFNERDVLSLQLFSLEGSRWRNLRAKLTPTFSSGKLKGMFGMVVACGRQMAKAMEDHCDHQGGPIDIKDWAARYGTDVIGTCAFGIECNSFQNPNSDFRRFSKRVLLPTAWNTFKIFLAFTNNNIGRMLDIHLTSDDVSSFFTKIVLDTIKYREENKVVRNDFLQILLDLRNATDESGHRLTVEEIVAQSFLFFLAGFETMSTAMTFCLYELALNDDVQEKVRDEVGAVLEAHNGELTYEAIAEIKYMKQVIEESLRKYPPASHLVRKCVVDYKVPGTDVTIESGTGVLIPVSGLHYDPDYFPDPEKFDPDRFSDDNRSKIRPSAYMAFGEGPRMCIGVRFAFLQLKAALALVLKDFRFTVSEKTRRPIQMNPKSLFPSVLGDIWLNIERM